MTVAALVCLTLGAGFGGVCVTELILKPLLLCAQSL